MNIGQYIFNFLFWGFALCSILYILAWSIVGSIVGVTWVKRKINKGWYHAGN